MRQNRNSLPLADTDVAILAGGLGKRLRGIVDNVPKPMAPVLGRPFLFYVLDMLALRGARSVTVCSGYLSELIRKQIGGEWFGMSINHSVETEPMGTAGALALAKPFLQSERVLVMNGDTWLEPDFSAFLHASSSADLCVAGVMVSDASRYGTLEADESGRLHAFNEKSASSGPGRINAGMYLMSQHALKLLPDGAGSLETDVFPVLVAEGRVSVFETSAAFIDIGIPSDYAEAEALFTELGIAPSKMFPDFPDMRNASVKLGTCIVIFDENQRVVLERRSDCGWWCLPGVRVDPSETVLGTALREAEEETGLKVQVTSFLGLFSDPQRRTVRYPDNGDIRQLIDATVVATPIGGDLAPSHESLEIRWFDPCELPLNTVPPVVEILRAAYFQPDRSFLR